MPFCISAFITLSLTYALSHPHIQYDQLRFGRRHLPPKKLGSEARLQVPILKLRWFFLIHFATQQMGAWIGAAHPVTAGQQELGTDAYQRCYRALYLQYHSHFVGFEKLTVFH